MIVLSMVTVAALVLLSLTDHGSISVQAQKVATGTHVRILKSKDSDGIDAFVPEGWKPEGESKVVNKILTTQYPYFGDPNNSVLQMSLLSKASADIVKLTKQLVTMLKADYESHVDHNTGSSSSSLKPVQLLGLSGYLWHREYKEKGALVKEEEWIKEIWTAYLIKDRSVLNVDCACKGSTKLTLAQFEAILLSIKRSK